MAKGVSGAFCPVESATPPPQLSMPQVPRKWVKAAYKVEALIQKTSHENPKLRKARNGHLWLFLQWHPPQPATAEPAQHQQSAAARVRAFSAGRSFRPAAMTDRSKRLAPSSISWETRHLRDTGSWWKLGTLLTPLAQSLTPSCSVLWFTTFLCTKCPSCKGRAHPTRQNCDPHRCCDCLLMLQQALVAIHTLRDRFSKGG